MSSACVASQLGLHDKASTRLKTTWTSTPAFVTTGGVRGLFMSATPQKRLEKRGYVGAEKPLSMVMGGCEHDPIYSVRNHYGNLRSRLRLMIEGLAYLAPPDTDWRKRSVGPAWPWYHRVPPWLSESASDVS